VRFGAKRCLWALCRVTLTVSVLRCGSVVDEAERIRKLYEYKNSLIPTVIATDPGDNTIAPYNQAYIDITFSTEVDTATFTAQANFGLCTGSFQVSYDGFTNCLGGTVDVSQNPRLRFTPTVFPKGLGLQIKVLITVLNPAGAPATPYISPVGFKLAAPCGNFNCFFSYSTPLTHSAATLSGIFRIQGGAHQGKYIVYSASGTATTMIDPLNGVSEAGPTLCVNPTNGSTDFAITTGTHAGKQLVTRGAGLVQTCLYDPANHNFSAGPNLTLGTNVGAFALQPGAGGDADNTLIFRGGDMQSVRYTAAGAGMATSGLTTAGNIADRAHAVRLTTGSDPGKFLIFMGSGSNLTNLLDPAVGGATLSPSANLAAALGVGALSFEVISGIQPNRVITLLGGGSASSVFSTSALGVAGAAGPSLATGTLGSGSLLLRQTGNISETRPLIINGGGSVAHATNYFDAANNVFVAGPMTTGAIGSASAAAWVPSAQGSGGGFLIVNGGAGYSTSIYLPHNNTFHGSRMPTAVPNTGAHAFRITGGVNDGKTLIVGGNSTNETALFDPVIFQMSRGPTLTANATINAMSMPITRGTNAGYVVVFHGGTAFSVYNPNTAAFISGGGFPFSASIGAGGQTFPVENSPNIIIVRGGSSIADKYNQETNLLGATVPVGFLVSGDPIVIRYVQPSTGKVKTMLHATTTNMRIFDHTTEQFTTTYSLGLSGGAGIKGFVIPSGQHAGKVIVMRGGGNPEFYMMDNETDLNDPATPDASACTPTLNSGSQVMMLTTGVNAGKVLVMLGGSSRSSCLYDPVGHRFILGPDVGNVPSPAYQLTGGSVAFRTGGGLYPTSFVVLSGSLKNVWSVYVP